MSILSERRAGPDGTYDLECGVFVHAGQPCEGAQSMRSRLRLVSVGAELVERL